VTLRLTLIRHVKSSWDGNEEDHERPLSKRGRFAADALGSWLEGRMPDQVLCSDAVRTCETWERIAAAGDGPPAQLVQRLYHADCDTILSVLRSAARPHVGIIGHNPGIALFAGRIVAERPSHPRFGDYPTGATTVMTFTASRWPDVGWQSGHVADFVVPREL
jgi:phosphohistidine phosphatase